MTTEIHALKRIAVYEETGTATFCTDHSGTLGDYIDVPAQEDNMTLTLTRNQLEPKTLQQYIDGYPTTVLGTKQATLSFTMVLAPSGTAATASVATLGTADSALYRLLKICMGGIQSGQQGTLDTGSSTVTAFNVTAGEATQFEEGGACGISTASTGYYEMREIRDTSSSIITVKKAVASAPLVNNVIHNATSLYLTEDPLTAAQFIVEGVEDDDRWLLLGGQGSFTIATPLGELPTITFTFTCANWLHGDDTAGPINMAAIQAAAYTNFTPTIVTGEFLAQVTAVGTTTRNIVQVSSIEFTPKVAYAPVASPSGTNTIARWRRQRTAPVCEVKFTTIYESDATWFDTRDARTDYHLALQIGNTAGSSVLITTPTAEITDVQRVDDGGLVAQQVTARARLDTDTSTAGIAALGRSAFRIHFG